MFYQLLKDVYTSNLFETCFMVANDDLKGKTTNFTGFIPIPFRTKNPKTNHGDPQERVFKLIRPYIT